MILQTDTLNVAFLDFFIVLLAILGNILLIIVGLFQQNKTEDNKYYYFFARAGAINLFWLLILPPLIDFLLVLVGVADANSVFWTLNILISGIISIISYGVIFTLFGLKDTSRYGRAIKFIGLFWVIAGVLDLIFIAIINSYIYLDVSAPDEAIKTMGWIFFYIGVALNIAAGSFLLAYSVELGERYLGLAALFFIIRGFLYAVRIIYFLPVL